MFSDSAAVLPQLRFMVEVTGHCSKPSGPRRAHRHLVAFTCYIYGMSRIRVSTTVDKELLTAARRIENVPDSKLLDISLRALLLEHRAAEIDAMYRAYDEQPLCEGDEWGDLSTWHEAADASHT